MDGLQSSKGRVDSLWNKFGEGTGQACGLTQEAKVSTTRQRPREIRVSVVFWRERGEFIGHCLQFDIVSVGDTLQEAADQMKKLILSHVNYVDAHDNWEYLYRPAPEEVWQRLGEAASRKELPRWTPRSPVTAIEWMADEARISTDFSFA